MCVQIAGQSITQLEGSPTLPLASTSASNAKTVEAGSGQSTSKSVAKSPSVGSNVQDTLTQRGKTHGRYIDQATTSVNIKNTFRRSKNWDMLKTDQQDALEMIAVKISRILTGDPNLTDSWHDIAGYATLVENRLNGIIK